MRSLEDLPPEVLAQILCNGSSWAAIELWKSGSKLLASKLVNGGVRELHLIDSRSIAFASWPRCLKEFKLRSLSVYIASSVVTPPLAIRRELKKLCHGLKKLVVAIPGCRFAFFDLPKYRDPSSIEERPHRAKRRALAEIDPNGALHEEMWDLNETFGELEHLEIFDDSAAPSQTSNPLPRLGEYIFALLPRSLTSFILENSAAINQLTTIEHFPPNLLTLRLPPASIPVRLIGDLPHSITDIGHGLSAAATFDLVANPERLPNLLDMPWPDTVPLDANTLLVWKLKSLPEFWKHVHAEVSDPECLFKVLPRKTLISLRLHSGSPRFNIGAHSFPTDNPFTSLVKLSVGRVDWSEMTAKSWPPLLTDLALTNDLCICATFFNRLSRNLKNLCINMPRDEMGFSRPESDVFDSNLSLANGIAALKSDADTWSTWKDTLSSNPNMFYGPDSDVSKRYVEAIEKGMAYGLPLGLTRLHMGRYLHVHEVNLVLPPHLTEVRLEYVKSVELWELFPPCVSELHLHAPLFPFHEYDLQRPPTNWRIADFERYEPPEDNPFFKLTSITTLKLKYMNATRAVDDLRLIPRSVVDLRFGAIDTPLVREDVFGLPSTLTRLNLTAGLTDSLTWIADLPQTLICLEIPNIQVYAADLAKLPRNLESFTAVLVDAFIKDIPSLPPRIRYAHIMPSPTERSYVVQDKVNPPLSVADWVRLGRAFVPLWRVFNATTRELERILLA